MRQINRHPQQGLRLILMLLPFVLLIAAWSIGSTLRLEANPQDKLLPFTIDFMFTSPNSR